MSEPAEPPRRDGVWIATTTCHRCGALARSITPDPHRRGDHGHRIRCPDCGGPTWADARDGEFEIYGGGRA